MSSDGEGPVSEPGQDRPAPSGDLEAKSTGEIGSANVEATASEPVRPPQETPAQAPSVEAPPRPPYVDRRPSRALIRPMSKPVTRSRFASFTPSHGAIAAAVALVLGAGFVAGAQVLAVPPKPTMTLASAGPPPETTETMLRHVQDEVRSLKVGLDAIRANAASNRGEDAIRSLKRSVDTLKGDLESVKAANGGVAAQLSAKIDRLDRDPTPKLAEIAARLDRMDKEPNPKLAEIASRLDHIDRDPTSKLAEITARLERMERQISSSASTGSIAPSPRTATLPVAAPAQPPEPKAPSKPATVAGWQLRDVYGGVALLEGRAGGLREVAPGEFVPGVGEIRAIERRGKSWVVVTSRGLIEADNRW